MNISKPASIATAASTRETTIRRTIILTLLYLIPSFGALKPILDPDIWWHLRTGGWIIQNHTTPLTDPFSSYGLGKPWIAYSWLFEILVYGLYEAFGVMGLVLYTLTLSLSIAIALHIFIGRLQPTFSITIFLTALGLAAVSPFATPRPWLFTIFLFTIQLGVILEARRTGASRTLWLLPPLFMLWANLHIQFIYGLIVLLLVSVEPIFERWFRRLPFEYSKNATCISHWFILTAACTAATLLTPYHFYQYGVIFGLIRQSLPFHYISELAPLSFRSVSDWFLLGAAFGAVYSLAWHRKIEIFPLMLLGLGAFLSFRARRDAWFLVVASVSIIAVSVSTSGRSTDYFRITRLRLILVASLVLIAIVVTGRVRNASNAILKDAIERKYPVNAIRFVKTHGYAGPLYNHFNWGGYLIWALPNVPVAMDGRHNIHGDERLERSFETWTGQRNWASDPELSAARLVIGGVNQALVSLLRFDPRFHLVYEDDVAAVFVARDRSPPQ